MTHFIEKCEKCSIIISQCRCAGEKEIRYSLCDNCNNLTEPISFEFRKKIKELVLEGIRGSVRSRQLVCGQWHDILHESRYLDVADFLIPQIDIMINEALNNRTEAIVKTLENIHALRDKEHGEGDWSRGVTDGYQIAAKCIRRAFLTDTKNG